MISLHEPTFDKADEEGVLDTLRSTWVSTSGPYVQKFEEQVAAYVGTRYAVSLSNGTVALQLMLEVLSKSLNIKAPYEVIVPTMTFIATANAVVAAGGSPVFLDTAPGLFNIEATTVAGFVRSHYERDPSNKFWISRKTKLPLLAIMPAHIMGWCCDTEELTRSCAELQLPMVEDAAEVLGSFDKRGKHVGCSGLAGGLSFNGNKIVTTGGGGMIVTNDKKFAEAAKHLSTTAKIDGLRYVHDEVGYNFRLVNILAALGCSQMQKLPDYLKRKRAIFDAYNKAFSGTDIKVHTETHCVSNNWLVNIRFKNEAARESALTRLMEHNIHARPLWTPIHLQPAYKDYAQPVAKFPHAEQVWKTTLSLPSSPSLKSDQIAQICELILSSQGASHD